MLWGGEADVPTQERYYSELYQEWEICAGFSYREYSLIYYWEDGSEEAQSSYVHVFKSDVDLTAVSPAPAPAPAETPSAAYDSEDTPENDSAYRNHQDLFKGPGQFSGIMGCKFNVSEGFTQQADEGLIRGPGMHRYSFRNNKLGMNISVFECTFLVLPITAANIPAEYKSVSSAEGVTHAASGTGYYVVSGNSGDDSIYYTRVDYNEDYYASLSFDYPTENGEACEKILLEF